MIATLLLAIFPFLPDVEAVRQARLEQNEAMAAGDKEKAASFWTEDVTLRRGLGASVIGKDAYLAFLDEKSLIFVREPDRIEVSPHWPLAYESGKWTAHRNSADGPAAISGRYSAQWVKGEDSWLIRSEIFVALNCNEDPCSWQALPIAKNRAFPNTLNSYYEKAKQNCHDLACIRKEMDRINNEILNLLAERTAYVKRSGDLKSQTTKIADDRQRVADQEKKIIDKSIELELPLEITVPAFRAIMENSIQYQQKYIDKLNQY